MKTVFKNIIAVILLLAVLLGSVLLVERALAPNNSTFAGFYDEPRDTIDAMFIGSSHGMAAFNPAQIWQEQGFTSYNMYSWSQPAWVSYHYAIEAIREQDPEVIVVEAFSFAYDVSYIEGNTADGVSNEFAMSIPPSLNRLQLAFAIRQHQYVPLSLSEMISFVRYHNRWGDITLTEMADNLFADRYSSNKGYGPIYTTEEFVPFAYEDKGTDTTMYPSCRLYLEKLIDLSEEEGIPLVVVKAPYVMEEQDRGYLEEIKAVCAEAGVPYLNYMEEDLLSEIGFDYRTDMAEHAHINYLGAEKISRHIGEYLKTNYLSDVTYSQDTIERWDEDSAVEMRDVDNWDLKLASDLGKISALLSEKEDFATIITAHGDMSAADGSHILSGLSAFGIDADILEKDNAADAFYYINGEKVSEDEFSALPFYSEMGISVSVSEDTSSITALDAEQSKNREGINIVMFDTRTGEVCHSASFATQHEYTHFTD